MGMAKRPRHTSGILGESVPPPPQLPPPSPAQRHYHPCEKKSPEDPVYLGNSWHRKTIILHKMKNERNVDNFALSMSFTHLIHHSYELSLYCIGDEISAV